MKNFNYLLLLVLLWACQSSPSDQSDQSSEGQTVAPTVNVLTEAEKAEGWKLLFDGQSTDPWRKYNEADFPSQGWVVKDGDLVIEKAPRPRPEGYGGDIITREKFGNFDLQVDFMVSDTANSGIFYFVLEEDGTPIYFNAPEYQLLDDQSYLATGQAEKGSTHLTGDNYDMEACAGDYSKPAGEWNTARIVHRNGTVEHWLNGNKCLSYQVGSETWMDQWKKSKFKDYPNYGQAREGSIGLQDHDHEVRFRNIKIRPL